HEPVHAGDVAVAARVHGEADEVAVRRERHRGGGQRRDAFDEAARLVHERFGGEDTLRRQAAEVVVVERQDPVGDVDRGGVRAGLGSFGNVAAELTVALEVAGAGRAVEHVVRVFGQQPDRALVPAQEGTRAIGQVAELVRVDGDRVHARDGGDGGVHAGGRERAEAGGDLFARAQAAVGVAEQAGQVAAPRGIEVQRQAQAAG